MDTLLIVDLKDLAVEILKRWKLLLLSMVIFALLLGAYGYYKKNTSDIIEATDESSFDNMINEAGSQLSAVKREEIDNLYRQYRSYIVYRRSLSERYSQYMLDGYKMNNEIYKTIRYLVTSDVRNVRVILQDSLTEKDFNEIGDIIGEDYSAVNNRGRNRVFLSYSSDVDNLLISESVDISDQFVLTEVIIGADEDQCNQIQTVVDKAMIRVLEKMHALDIEIEMNKVTESFRDDVPVYMSSGMQNVTTQLRTITDSLNVLQLNTIDKLSEPELAYFACMKQKDEFLDEKMGNYQPADAVSETEAQDDVKRSTGGISSVLEKVSKKYVLAGLFLGFILVCAFLIMRYLFDGKIKTASELPEMYGLPVLNSYSFREKRRTAFLYFLFLNLKGTGSNLELGKEWIAAEDIQILLKKKAANTVYFIHDTSNDLMKKMSNDVKNQINAEENELRITCGDPMADPQQMKELASADAVCLFAQMKKDNRTRIDQWEKMCSRYNVPVLGAVTVEGV